MQVLLDHFLPFMITVLSKCENLKINLKLAQILCHLKTLMENNFNFHEKLFERFFTKITAAFNDTIKNSLF